MVCGTWLLILGLSPPSRPREGLVTDSSIELLWDPAEGDAHSYEVICFNCDHSHMVNRKQSSPSLIKSYNVADLMYLVYVLQVQKVFSQSAVFSNLTPGRLYLFAIRTEKESFADSSPVAVNITAGKHTQRTHTSLKLSFPLTTCDVFFIYIWQHPTPWRCL